MLPDAPPKTAEKLSAALARLDTVVLRGLAVMTQVALQRAQAQAPTTTAQRQAAGFSTGLALIAAALRERGEALPAIGRAGADRGNRRGRAER